MRIGIITRQWLLKTFLIVSLLMAAIAATLSFAMHSFYYNTVRSTLSAGYNSIVSRYFNAGAAGTSDEEFNRIARAYIESYSLRDIVDVWVIDRHGAVVATSDGFRVPDGRITRRRSRPTSARRLGRDGLPAEKRSWRRRICSAM